MVGAAGFEPTTPSPPVKCATGLRYAPTCQKGSFSIGSTARGCKRKIGAITGLRPISRAPCCRPCRRGSRESRHRAVRRAGWRIKAILPYGARRHALFSPAHTACRETGLPPACRADIGTRPPFDKDNLVRCRPKSYRETPFACKKPEFNHHVVGKSLPMIRKSEAGDGEETLLPGDKRRQP